MLIYQISTEDKSNIFDFALKDKFADKDEYISNYKKMLGTNIDSAMLRTRTEHFNTFDYLILDREAFANNDMTIVQAFKSTKSFVDKPTLIFIWKDIPENCKQDLIKSGIQNLIISDNFEEQKEEILECLSVKGMQRYNQGFRTNDNENYEKYEFKISENYAIQIMTTNNELKCKSISLSLCKYIDKVGGKVLYIAPFYSDKDVLSIANLLEADKEEIYYKKDNIYISNDLSLLDDLIFDKNINFYIQDNGHINEKTFLDNLELIKNEQFDKNIVLCDLNILEMETIKTMLENLDDKRTYIANSSNKKIDIEELDKSFNNYRDYLKLVDTQRRIKELYKQDELIDIRTNRNFFNMLIEPHIIAKSS